MSIEKKQPPTIEKPMPKTIVIGSGIPDRIVLSVPVFTWSIFPAAGSYQVRITSDLDSNVGIRYQIRYSEFGDPYVESPPVDIGTQRTGTSRLPIRFRIGQTVFQVRAQSYLGSKNSEWSDWQDRT